MNEIVLLAALLAVGYLGSFLAGERAVRGFGLPSSVEWVAIGFVLGPHVLGVVGGGVIATIEPVLYVGIGWLSLAVGLDYGHARGRALRAGRILGGMAWGLATSAPVGACVWAAVPLIWPALAAHRLSLAIGIAAVSSETTRHVMDWVAERHGAKGPLLDLMSDLSDAEDVVPVLAVGTLVALDGSAVRVRWLAGASVEHVGARLGVTVGVGLLLGAVCAWLLGRELRLRESWGLLIGIATTGIGVAARAGLSVVATLFSLGLALGVLAHHAKDVRRMVLSTERSAMIPTLLVCGATLALPDASRSAYVLGAALAARLVVTYALGGLVGAVVPRARPAGGLFGAGMLSTGALSMSIGLACALRFPGPVGDVILAAAALACITGEAFGPPALRAALRRAGELGERQAPGARPEGEPV